MKRGGLSKHRSSTVVFFLRTSAGRLEVAFKYYGANPAGQASPCTADNEFWDSRWLLVARFPG